ncbi:hypothetical protein CLOP_g25002 [Closterium sp. NIES-67]|nr:hypothetical protein CLOP_g25002 [Closterium sp. NIES-67]
MGDEGLRSAVVERLRAHLQRVRVADGGTRVYKEECCITFDTPRSKTGLLVDLNSFLAFSERAAAWQHAKTGNAVFLRIREVEKEKERKKGAEGEDGEDGEEMDKEPPSKKPTLLAIGMEGGFNPEKEVQYEARYSVVLLPDKLELPYPNNDLPEIIRMSVESVIAAEGAERKQQVSAWVAEKKRIAKSALSLVQLDNGVKVPSLPALWQCAKCEKKENLWMNLSDGTILCGRKLWDGTGGNGHALTHYEETKFPLAVKLGTITPDLETADVYSYEEDDTVEDPLLAKHLAHFGIDFSALTKTEQTTAERELDQNLSFDWNRMQEQGKALQPLFGRGLTGLANLGNSCYLAAVMQVLFSTPHFSNSFYDRVSLEQAFAKAPSDPTTDFATQIVKLAHGLLSGEYSHPVNEPGGAGEAAGSSTGKEKEKEKEQEKELYQAGIPPRMFKSVIGKGHVEFSTSRQQDALEFYQYLLEQIQKLPPPPAAAAAALQEGSRGGAAGAEAGVDGGRGGGGEGVSAWRSVEYVVEDRIECGASQQVKYTQRPDNVWSLPIPLDAATNKDQVAAFEVLKKERESRGEKMANEEVVRPRVPLSACIDRFAAQETIPGFFSTAINGHTTALKTTRFASFPDVLVVQMRKYVLESGTWVPRKLDVFLDVPDRLDLSHLRGKGLQPGEQVLPEDANQAEAAAPPPSSGPAVLQADEVVVASLESMGFPRVRCEKAAVLTGNAGVEEAANWIFEHMDDADIDDPLPPPGAPSAAPAPAAVDEVALGTLMSFGFSDTAARNALTATGGDVERAADWILNNPAEAEAPPAAAAAAAAAPTPMDVQPSGDAAAAAPVDLTSKVSDGPGTYELFAFVSHMGANTQCGHYVAHIRKGPEGKWVLFNDAKVAISEDPPKDMGYLYFFRRCSAPVEPSS